MGLSRERIEGPPRTVSPALAAQMMFGDTIAQIGWLLVAFGSFFFWMFAMRADLTGWRFAGEGLRTVPGQALECRDTKYSVGGSEGTRGTSVYENRYRYQVEGVEYDGKSYDTGDCRSGGGVTVEYLAGQPGYSRIQGMRRGLLGPGAAPLGGLFPFAGLVMALIGVWRGRLCVRLLREGLTAPGQVYEKSPTGSRTMGRMMYKVTVEFTARDAKEYRTTVFTEYPERLGDDSEEAVLYLPEDPSRALPLDVLPGSLSVDYMGRFQPGPSRKYAVLPVISLVLNAWLMYRWW